MPCEALWLPYAGLVYVLAKPCHSEPAPGAGGIGTTWGTSPVEADSPSLLRGVTSGLSLTGVRGSPRFLATRRARRFAGLSLKRVKGDGILVQGWTAGRAQLERKTRFGVGCLKWVASSIALNIPGIVPFSLDKDNILDTNIRYE